MLLIQNAETRALAGIADKYRYTFNHLFLCVAAVVCFLIHKNELGFFLIIRTQNTGPEFIVTN